MAGKDCACFSGHVRGASVRYLQPSTVVADVNAPEREINSVVLTKDRHTEQERDDSKLRADALFDKIPTRDSLAPPRSQKSMSSS
jgi:hypothetical protein